MIRYNFKLFLIFFVTIIFWIVLKNGHIFDLGLIFRKALVPQNARSSLLNPPDDLAVAYQQLLVENTKLQILAEENEQLRNLLNFQKERGYPLVLANIVSRDSANPGIIMISVGAEQGLQSGQAVVVASGIMIGRVVSVGQDYAQVRLLTDKFSKIAVKVGAKEGLAGLLSGALGLSMSLTYVPQELELKKGDLVLTAETGSVIPAGLIVGQVESVDFAPEELFKKAAVTPFLDYNTLATVAVLVSL